MVAGPRLPAKRPMAYTSTAKGGNPGPQLAETGHWPKGSGLKTRRKRRRVGGGIPAFVHHVPPNRPTWGEKREKASHPGSSDRRGVRVTPARGRVCLAGRHLEGERSGLHRSLFGGPDAISALGAHPRRAAGRRHHGGAVRERGRPGPDGSGRELGRPPDHRRLPHGRANLRGGGHHLRLGHRKRDIDHQRWLQRRDRTVAVAVAIPDALPDPGSKPVAVTITVTDDGAQPAAERDSSSCSPASFGHARLASRGAAGLHRLASAEEHGERPLSPTLVPPGRAPRIRGETPFASFSCAARSGRRPPRAGSAARR